MVGYSELVYQIRALRVLVVSTCNLCSTTRWLGRPLYEFGELNGFSLYLYDCMILSPFVGLLVPIYPNLEGRKGVGYDRGRLPVTKMQTKSEHHSGFRNTLDSTIKLHGTTPSPYHGVSA